MSHHQSVPATWHTVIGSPLGESTLVRDTDGMRGLYFPHHWYRPDPATFGPRVEEGFQDCEHQVGEYLAGRRRTFDVPLIPGGSPLQRHVWDLIGLIPYGETTTYGDVANVMGDGVTARRSVRP